MSISHWDNDEYWCMALSQYISTHIPLCTAMELKITSLTERELLINAPLTPNINDKGTAFGGAIASLLTICGWSVMWLLSQRHALDIDLVVTQSHIRYLLPARAELQVRCTLPSPQEWQSFTQKLQHKGRARMSLEPVLESNKDLAATMVAEYAGLMKTA